MAPFLNPPRLPARLPAGPNKYDDEAFVLPALIRFGGEAFVDDNGGLLYRFPRLQVQASELPKVSGPQQSKVPLEREWDFSAATPGEGLRGLGWVGGFGGERGAVGASDEGVGCPLFLLL